ncbi:MAG: AAA family ATPase, partial [Bradyrhizobium sp.]
TDAARERHAATEREINRHAARKSALTEARTRLAADRSEAQGAHESANAALAELPPSLPTETKLAEVKTGIDGCRRIAAQVRAEAQALAREAELADRRLQAIIAERNEWQSRKTSATSQVETIEVRVNEIKAERAELENAPAIFAEKRRALINEIETAKNGRRSAADALAEAENVMAETDRAAKASLEALSSSREATARAEERMDGAKRRLVDIEREIHDMLEIEPHAVSGLAEIEPGAELPPLAEIEENLEKLRRDRERLLASFETVNGHFKRLFVELFGGGEAALHLIESEDPLEAGLEIIAKPPGKKPQTLSLLSGGEQALTALALIFAVFLTNPSPICVLDEVDAPLDDHNVERFCNLLHEMTATTETRFVIITHNPITMARMNRLFGVTMAERGVSQLVSVALDEAVKILDQNVA